MKTKTPSLGRTRTRTRGRSRGRTKQPRGVGVFTAKHFSSGDGMLTTIWGPGQWHFLHTMSFNYPVHPTEQEKKHYRDYILSLQHVLPCKYCRMNLKKNLRKLPLTMKHMASRDSFSKYVYQLHELVNEMLLKKSNLSYEAIRERYEHFRARCSAKKHNKVDERAMNSHSRARSRKLTHGGKRELSSSRPQPEKGCTEPLVAGAKKAKAKIQIIPLDKDNKDEESIQVDPECLWCKQPPRRT